MKLIIRDIRKFRTALGPVEQAQIVASTAVVVAMITIVMVRLLSGYKLGWFDFVSVTTVGIFGYLIVYFTLKYGRLLEEQTQELMALNSLGEAVNRAVEINLLLNAALVEVIRLLEVEYGWIYHAEGGRMVLKTEQGGSEQENDPIPTGALVDDQRFGWIRAPRIERIDQRAVRRGQQSWPYQFLQSWASVPIMVKNSLSGVMVLGSTNRKAFTSKQLGMMSAFANQIGVALENAGLFERVRRSEERYMDLFEHAPDMNHIVSRDGIIVSSNKTELDRLGYRREDLVGQSVLRLYKRDYHETARSLLEQMFEGRREFKELEEQMITVNGEVLDVSVNTSLIYDERGEPVFIRAAARDVTERKKLEAKILHAQRIDSIGNLAGGVAHDFNNILTSILGSTAIMKRKMKKGDPWYRFVDIIETAARRGSSLTRQLLTFARKSTIQFRPVMVNDVVEETLHLFERSTDKTIVVEKEFSPRISIINGDDGQLQQALLNLLINARDAMPEGGKIMVGTDVVEFTPIAQPSGNGERSGKYVVISVRDTGIGMDRETQQKIFEPFFTTKEQGKGTGLGLSVVYGVVNGHDGFITVESEPGQGSIFRLHFPLLKESDAARRPARRSALLKGSEQVLVIDDEEHVSEIIAAMLKDLGYKVTVVNSGADALEELKNHPKKYDAVVLDMNMPKMGGKETFIRLKEAHPDLRVLISTGYGDASIAARPLQEAIDGFLQKPYQLEELSKAMRHVLDKH